MTLHFVWCGLGFVCFVDILLFGPWRLVWFTVFWRWWVRVVLGMVLFIFFLLVLLRLVFDGTLMLWLGPDLVCLSLAILLALFSISRLLFLMLGVIRLLLTVAAGRVFRGVCWMCMALCSSITLLMFEKEIRLCFVASWLGVSGTVFFLAGFVARLFHVGFVGTRW